MEKTELRIKWAGRQLFEINDWIRSNQESNSNYQTRLDHWTRLDWTKLDRTRLDWTRLDWTVFVELEKGWS